MLHASNSTIPLLYQALDITLAWLKPSFSQAYQDLSLDILHTPNKIHI